MHPSSRTPSPTGAQPPDSQPEMTPHQMMEAVVKASVLETMQLRRTLWLVLRQTRPVSVDETECHPLWRMKATRLENGRMLLEALELPEPTAEQLSQLAETLNGSKADLEEAMQQTELKDHPPAYVQMRLGATLVRRDDGQWVDAKFAKVQDQKPTGTN